MRLGDERLLLRDWTRLHVLAASLTHQRQSIESIPMPIQSKLILQSPDLTE